MKIGALSEELQRAFRALEDTDAELASVTVPVDMMPPRADGASIAFDEPGSRNRAFGVAKLLSASGPDRTAAIRRAADRVRIARIAPEGAPPLRWWGGFGFEPDPAAGWIPLGPARFVMPEVWWHRSHKQTWLTLTWDAEEDPPDWQEPVDLDASVGSGHETGSVDLPVMGEEEHSGPLDLVDSGVEAYLEAVPQILTALNEGEVAKVVLSRAVTYRFTGTPAELFHRAEEEQGDHARLMFHAGTTAIVGVTPERLVAVAADPAAANRRVVFTEALAASAPLDRAEGLPDQAKERAEHRLVVDAIVAGLARVGVEARVGPTRVRRLNRIAHLATPVQGTGSSRLHVLDAVATLHPTPATAGQPQDRALEVIRRAEPTPRGWYCGAVGWFAQDGTGDFRVALRSLRVTSGTLTVFVGGGWVKGSIPEAEFEETALKEQAVRAAFGLEVVDAV